MSGDKVHLECGVQDLGPGLLYTTLSHMWGPDPSACPQLERHNLEAYTADIPVEMLPGKYADAIRITRALGFRYLWIDSLCIVQDWPEDWTREALKMAAVYGRSSCNISYTFPPAAEKCKNYLRDARAHLPCRVSLHKQGGKQTSNATSDTFIIQHRSGYLRPAWSPTVYKRIWPLLSRGWVFQERLLCCRTVYYGQERLLWECCDGIIDEFYGPLAVIPNSKAHFYRVITGIASSLSTETETKLKADLDSDGIASQSVPGPRSKGGSHFAPALRQGTGDDATKAEIQWGALVRDYRAGDLTKEKDRGIAFAGIVRAIQSSSQNKITYLAGLWKELFGYDLLWSVNPIAIDAGM